MKFDLKNFKYFSAADVETESLNGFTSRPWQIAWVNFDHKGNILESQDRYIWWEDLNISEDAKKITHFDYEKYKEKAEPADLVWKDWKKTYEDKSCGLVLHNGILFDASQINNWARNIKVFTPWKDNLFRYIDTHLISKGIKLDMEIDKNNFLNWQYKVGSIRAKVKTNLKTMCQENGIDFDESRAHEAAYDAERTKCLFLQYIRYKLN